MLRKSPLYLAFLFIAITLTRVAMLVASGFGAGILGWMFSVGMGVAVFVTSYYSRVAITSRDGKEDKRSIRVRTVAVVGLAFFVVIDGYFNIIEVLRTLLIPELYYPALVYGAFPTIAAALLAALQGYVDRLPVPPTSRTYNVWNAMRARIVRSIESSTWLLPPVGENSLEMVSAPTPYDQFAVVHKVTPLKAKDVMIQYHVSVSEAYEWLRRFKVENPVPTIPSDPLNPPV